MISDTTNEVVDLFEPLDTAQYLTSIAYDYRDNEVFTQYTGSPGTVAVTSAATNTLVATITTGDVSEYNTNGLAYDSGLGEVFASNGESSNISVISTATNKLVASVDLYDEVPQALAYDSGTHQIFAANDGFGENVSVISDASNTLVKSIGVGTYPDAIAYDRGKGEVFVANGDSANVSVINDTTDTVLASVDLPAGGANAAAYDPAQHEVFFTIGNRNETVISDATNAVVATVPLDLGPNGAAYDSSKGEVWVLNGEPVYVSAISDTSNTVVENVLLTFTSRYWAYDSAHQEEFLADETSGQVAVVSDTTDHVVAMVQLPGDPEPVQVVYDSGRGEVFTADYSGGVGLSVINDTSDTVVHTIPLPGVAPTGMAYDRAKGEIFVGNEGGGNNVTIVNDTTNTVVGVVPNVGTDPWSLLYDSRKGEIFVANLGSGISGSNVTVINDTTDTIVASINVGTEPVGGMVYDSGKGEIFVTNFVSDNVSVISDATNKVVASIYTGTFAWGAAYDPAADEVFVGNFNGAFMNVTVISDVTDTTVGSISPDGFAPSSVAFDPVTGDLYSGDSIYGTVALITPLSGPSSAHYPVTFTESGLPSGTLWSVTFNSTLNSSTTNSIGYSVLDGSYSFTVGSVTGYTPMPASGPVTVNGGPQTVAIVFTAYPPGKYPVTFTETGLPVGTSWSVTFNSGLNSSTTVTIGFFAANGSYSFTVGTVAGYTATPGSGPLTVNGGPASQEIKFTAASAPSSKSTTTGFLGLPGWEGYGLLGGVIALLAVIILLAVSRRHKLPVVFTESGLPGGSQWSVALDGSLQSAKEEVIMFTVASGTHSYRVGSVGGLVPSPESGSLEVKRDRVDVRIRFGPPRPKT